MKAIEEVFRRRDQLEFEINAIEVNTIEIPKEKDVGRDPEDERIREQMESSLVKVTMDIEQIKSELALLTSEFDEIL